MLEVSALSVQAGSFLLRDVSLSLADGECHVILGPTGSGKTLLLESVIGFRKPLSGRISQDGRDIKGLPVEKREISYVPQDLAIFPHLTVIENVFYGLKVKRIKEGEILDRARELMRAVGIDHLADRYPANLSGGERQRVALVRAIACAPRLLFLDEPFSALNESLRKELWFMLKDLQARYRLTILMITHNMEEAFFLGDTISIIIDGRLRQSGRSTAIYNAPADMDVAAFMGIKNLFEADVESLGENMASLACRDLGATVTAPLPAQCPRPTIRKGQRIRFGIRSEEIHISTSFPMGHNGTTSLKGSVVNIIGKGSTHLVFFSPGTGSGVIEAEISSHLLRKLNLRKGQSVSASFESDSVFLLC